MIKAKLLEALNEQIQREFNSAYAYLAMAAHFDSLDLRGFAHWMRTQSQEEWGHGMKLFDHILDRGNQVSLRRIDPPTATFKSPLDTMKVALAHEQKMAASVDALYAQSLQAKDYPAQLMLEWLVNRQVEEEREVGQVVNQLGMVGDSGAALLMLDRELGRDEIPGTGAAGMKDASG